MHRAWLILAALALASCSDDAQQETEPAPSPETLPGVYAGRFPCENCPGILATLWLRKDGRFFLEQEYLADGSGGDSSTVAYALGRWQWRDDERILALSGAGPQRLFDRSGADALLMQSGSVEEHRLERKPGASLFSGALPMRGLVSRRGEQIVFAECLTGFETPFAKGGEYPRFLRQFRSVSGGRAELTADIEGRFKWSGDGTAESISIERFVALRAGSGCGPGG